MPSDLVDANYRFIAASNELNARISQRLQALGLYLTLTLGLLAALLGLQHEGGAPRLPVHWLSLGFPVASWCLVLLNYKTERALAHLRGFLSALEQLGDAHLRLPSYNTDPRWSLSANSARRFQDYAAGLLAGAGNGLALGALWYTYPAELAGARVLLWLSTSTAALSVLALFSMQRLAVRAAGSAQDTGPAPR
ncbi:hypothetical protein OOT46_04560 [Aquabacterium sp. A7-Y]|uniref:hypothetical protein n=1 Tax=Aquabacterium sp. A7-Y TaxID=1349605 RepID=UPI00223D8BD4|nr:hypothetical protein [Aquabacterium sp. A7-Y]MCW7537124.1 hypothetical protein [Aquabacterium sp. A7-Y]